MDKNVHLIMKILTVFSIVTILAILLGLLYKAYPILKTHSLTNLLLSKDWFPQKELFGLFPFISSTFQVTGLAMFIAVPFCLLASIYLSEYASKSITRLVLPLIDILAGIPSVIFGIWGIILIVPFIRDYVAPFFGKVSSGYSILTGGIVLAVMLIPVMVNILLEVFNTVSRGYKEASLALGATKWQCIKHVLLIKSAPGIISAIALSLSRAFGETLAVLMVVGNVTKSPKSILDPAQPLPALIANNYGEMMSVDLYDSALLLASLVLFIIVLFFNIIARVILRRLEKNNH
ncbi:MAG: phosphate ABC transporter permease subunit PstC [Cytophagales bacterium]|nr:MAG: phosphate ABC transporter permease subunit PstC [Cytophagales bacterium]